MSFAMFLRLTIVALTFFQIRLHQKHLSDDDDDGDLDDDDDLADDHLVHVLLHLLLPRVLLSRLTGRRNEAVIRVQSLGDKQCGVD